jgi:hypothetical protein
MATMATAKQAKAAVKRRARSAERFLDARFRGRRLRTFGLFTLSIFVSPLFSI